MSEFFSRLTVYFSYPFVWYALIVGVLISLCASVFGVILVLKRYSFLGDGLSHVAFGALAVATVLKLFSETVFVLPVTALCAVLLLKGGKRGKLPGDAAIAVMSVGALGIGYLILDLGSASANVAGDVCSSLFGSFSILTLSASDLWICLILSVIVLGLFALFYRRIFVVTHDEDFARTLGIRTSVYNLFLAIVTAVIIVLAMNLVGSLLISALIVFPALSAMRLCRSFRATILCSAAFGTGGACLGILTSLIASTPVGPTIVAMELGIFFLANLLGRKA